MLKPEQESLLRPPGGPVIINGQASAGDSMNGPPRGKAPSSGKAPPTKASMSVAAGASYCCASVTMVLVNKLVLSGFSFGSPTALLFLQCSMAVMLVLACTGAGLVRRQPLCWQIVRKWAPANALFVGMLWTGFAALKHLKVPTVTVLKNLANVFTILGDWAFYGRTYGAGVWATLGLMALSALANGLTDLEFSAAGYWWQLVNCMCTAAYSLYLRKVMDDVREHTEDGGPLNEVTMVLINNALSLPLLALMMAANGELLSLPAEPDLRNATFLAAASVSGLVAFGISFASVWFLSTTTPTTYSLVGSLNKVPTALLGLLLFPDRNRANPRNLASIGLGLAAGVVFVWSKDKSRAACKGHSGGGGRLAAAAGGKGGEGAAV